jgi:hypothetical protein
VRDYTNKINEKIIDELQFYLTDPRPLYVTDYEWKDSCDLVVDGSLPINDQISLMLNKIHSFG